MKPISFPQFSSHRMPEEIKEIIWTYAMVQILPRTIHINVRSNIHQEDTGAITSIFRYVSSAQIPSILHACSKSRKLAQKRWTLSFRIPKHFHQLRNQLNDSDYVTFFEGEDVPTIWIDFDSDTLLCFERSPSINIEREFPMPTFSMDVDIEERSQVRKLWLEWNCIATGSEERFHRNVEHRNGKITTQEIQCWFPGLKQLFLGTFEKMVFAEVEDEWIQEGWEAYLDDFVRSAVKKKGWGITVETLPWNESTARTAGSFYM